MGFCTEDRLHDRSDAYDGIKVRPLEYIRQVDPSSTPIPLHGVVRFRKVLQKIAFLSMISREEFRRYATEFRPVLPKSFARQILSLIYGLGAILEEQLF